MTSIQISSAAAAPLAPPDVLFARVRDEMSRLRGCLRNMAFAAILSLPAAVILHAEGTQPDWLPETLQLPTDMDILTDRSIGSTLRMFSFSTDSNADTLLDEWEEALRQSGYTIDLAEDGILDQMIEFSGHGINNAKIVISPIEDEDGRAIIEFDATLQ